MTQTTLTALLLIALSNVALGQTAAGQNDTLPIKPPPVPGGVIPLPAGAPPTGRQAPVPPPAAAFPKSDRPLTVSPRGDQIRGYVEGRAITLQDAVAISLYTSREFAAAAAALQQARGRTGQARTQLNPTFGINGDLTEYDAPTTATLGQGSPPITIIPQFNPAATAAIGLPIDLFGSIRAAISQAQFQEVAARIDINRVRNDLVLNVKNAFYNVLRAQAQTAVALDTLNNAVSRLNDANKNYAAGTAPRFDVISAQRDVADAEQGVINARAQLSVNLAALKNTMGIDIKTRLRVTDANAVDYPPGVAPLVLSPIAPPQSTPSAPTAPIETPAPATTPTITVPESMRVPNGQIPANPSSVGEVEDTFEFGPEFDALLADAGRNRPEVLEADAQIAAAQRGVRFARRSSLPSFNLTVSDTYTPNAAGFTRRNVGAIGLGVSLPIFDGGLARARVEEARGAVASAEVSRRRLVDQVRVDVQQAYIALVQARSRVAVANVGLTQAREAYRLARVRYNAGVSQQTGVSPQLELSNAQTTLAQALSNLVNALYDYNSARAQVDRAAGRYAFTGVAPGYTSAPGAAERGAAR